MNTISNEKTNLIQSICEINQSLAVDLQIVDLIAGFIKIRLDKNKPIEFYNLTDKSVPIVKNKKIKSFLYKNRHLDPRILQFLAVYAQEMLQKGMPFVFNVGHLAKLLKITKDKMDFISAYPKRYYRTFYIKKRNSSKREISTPRKELKDIQRWILRNILDRIKLSPNATGFRKKRSISTNARKHLKKKIVIKVDLEKFFPSVNYSRVLGVFRSFGFPDSVAVVLAKLTTYKGKLPMGAPTSPAISNIIARKLDKRFTQLGKKIGFNYSRYADDIAISSNKKRINKSIPFFRKIIEEEGFKINEEKLCILRNGNCQKITGVVVNKKANISRKKYKWIRAILHNCRTKGVDSQRLIWEKKKRVSIDTNGQFKNILLGHINFIRMINKRKGSRLFKEFKLIA